jgi:RNA polymerase sigma-70 factor (ECF subfamily)
MSKDTPELQALIRAAQKGDENAFEALLTRYELTVYRIVYAILGNGTDAEDVTQEIFIKLWRTLPRYHYGASFSTYLTRIAHNAAYDYLRANRRRAQTDPLYHTGADGEQEVLPLPDPDPQSDPMTWYLSREAAAQLRDAIDRLPPDMREILVLRLYCSYSYEQIATLLSLSEGTVKSRLHRAKKILQKLLQNGNFF